MNVFLFPRIDSENSPSLPLSCTIRAFDYNLPFPSPVEICQILMTWKGEKWRDFRFPFSTWFLPFFSPVSTNCTKEYFAVATHTVIVAYTFDPRRLTSNSYFCLITLELRLNRLNGHESSFAMNNNTLNNVNEWFCPAVFRLDHKNALIWKCKRAINKTFSNVNNGLWRRMRRRKWWEREREKRWEKSGVEEIMFRK